MIIYTFPFALLMQWIGTSYTYTSKVCTQKIPFHRSVFTAFYFQSLLFFTFLWPNDSNWCKFNLVFFSYFPRHVIFRSSLRKSCDWKHAKMEVERKRMNEWQISWKKFGDIVRKQLACHLVELSYVFVHNGICK